MLFMYHTAASEGFAQAWDILVLGQFKQVTVNHPHHIWYTTTAWRKFPLGLILLMGLEVPAKSSGLTQSWLFQMEEWAQRAHALWIPAFLLPGNGLRFPFKGSVNFPGNPEHVSVQGQCMVTLKHIGPAAAYKECLHMHPKIVCGAPGYHINIDIYFC